MKLDSVKRNLAVVVLFKYGFSMQETADAMGLDVALVEEVIRQRLSPSPR